MMGVDSSGLQPPIGAANQQLGVPFLGAISTMYEQHGASFHQQQQQHAFTQQHGLQAAAAATAAAQQQQQHQRGPAGPPVGDLHRLKICGVPAGTFSDAKLRQLFELCGKVRSRWMGRGVSWQHPMTRALEYRH